MKRKSDLLKNMNPTLKELILATLAWGLLFCLVFVWFSRERISFVVSIAAGTAVSVAMACHMTYAIEQSLEMREDDAPKYMRRGAVLRFVMMAVLMVAAWRLGGNVGAVFFGLLTLKFGAYTQPFVHKILRKYDRKEEGR